MTKAGNGQKSDLRRDNLITALLRSSMETPLIRFGSVLKYLIEIKR